MAPIEHGDIKILVVDDEAAARSALSELLRDEGYVVHTAGDGFKALGQLEEWTPDIVVTDVQMPGMSGIELMEKVREFLDAGVEVVCVLDDDTRTARLYSADQPERVLQSDEELTFPGILEGFSVRVGELFE